MIKGCNLMIYVIILMLSLFKILCWYFWCIYYMILLIMFILSYLLVLYLPFTKTKLWCHWFISFTLSRVLCLLLCDILSMISLFQNFGWCLCCFCRPFLFLWFVFPYLFCVFRFLLCAVVYILSLIFLWGEIPLVFSNYR